MGGASLPEADLCGMSGCGRAGMLEGGRGGRERGERGGLERQLAGLVDSLYWLVRVEGMAIQLLRKAMQRIRSPVTGLVHSAQHASTLLGSHLPVVQWQHSHGACGNGSGVNTLPPLPGLAADLTGTSCAPHEGTDTGRHTGSSRSP